MTTWSKSIKKWDESAKNLIIQLLDWDKTWWFDLDSVYCVKWKYYVIEFLKCESTIPWINPFTSHPNKYRFNKQKFISLWNITNKLNWTLYLINYEMDEEWNAWDRFKLMKVIELNEKKWIKTLSKNMNFNEMKKWRRNLNQASLQQ